MANLTDDCVEWDGTLLPKFYGTLAIKKNGRWQSGYIHRVAWEEVHGPIPWGMCVLHRCDNPPCFLVDHLFLGTNADNSRDAVDKGRTARGIGHGRHKLTEAQVWLIRDRLAQGVVQRIIAAEVGCCQVLVSRIKLGKNWAHLTERPD